MKNTADRRDCQVIPFNPTPEKTPEGKATSRAASNIASAIASVIAGGVASKIVGRVADKPMTREQRNARKKRCLIFASAATALVLIVIIAACTVGDSKKARLADLDQNAGNATPSADIDDRQDGGGEETWFPTAEQIAELERKQRVESIANLMVANYVRIGTPIDGYWNGGNDETRAEYETALIRAQARIDELPDKWVLPEVIYIELAGQNLVPLSRVQMGNLREAYGFLTRGFGVLPNYLNGLEPHIVAGFMGNLGASDSFWNDTSRSNGHFGICQLGPELYAAYEVWCTQGASDEIYTEVRRQMEFLWAVLNGWGYGTYITQDYGPTLADLLESETAAEAATILNSGKAGSSRGFFRGNREAQRIEWAEQIYAQLLQVRP